MSTDMADRQESLRLLLAQIDEFMAWLFRDGGAEPPRRDYDAVSRRLRTFLLSAGLRATAPGELDVERLEVALRAVDERIAAEDPQYAGELLDPESDTGRRDYALAIATEYFALSDKGEAHR